MVARVKTFAFLGIDVAPVDVQIKISSGIPAFNIVGLPDKAIAESKERVRAAISSIGLSLPPKRITVNLAPADLSKEGSHFDLGIALGLLIEMEIIKQEDIEQYYCLGELALDGRISKVNGILSAAIGANSRDHGIICPKSCGSEAVWAGKNFPILAPDNLVALINHFKAIQMLKRPETISREQNFDYPDLKDIKGQDHAKRALEIAAAGNHNILMIGPPGSGKSMLASRLPSIIPDLGLEEMLEINMIYSINGIISDGKLINQRPFRNVHHSCSMPAMVGGGTKAKPGEISLAHNGILFLDELAEFPRQVLDSLRQPLENGNVTISRVNSHVNYPANFQLVAAMNPCRCGHLMDEGMACNKAPNCARDYQNKISGPLLDRMDIVVEVPKIDIFGFGSAKTSESSTEVKQRVFKARQIQNLRYKNQASNPDQIYITNAKVKNKILEPYIAIDDQSNQILKNAVEKMNISMRGISRILRVSRTIADLENQEKISQNHIIEAISYRRKLLAN